MHKAYCRCKHCEEGRRLEKSLRPSRYVPKFVMEQIKQKSYQKEEEMLKAGYFLIECPYCRHSAYTKISSVMKCSCCCKILT